MWSVFFILMKIVTWNVNSIRARIENIKLYLSSSKPDIVLLQEIKTQDATYPYEDIKKLGYISYVSGQKSYNGVAILSKKKVREINNVIPKSGCKIINPAIVINESTRIIK